MIPKWFQSHPKVTPKLSQSHPKVIPKSSESHPKVIPKSPQSHPKVIPKSPWKSLEILGNPLEMRWKSILSLRSPKDDPKVVPKSSESHPKVTYHKVIQKSSQSHPTLRATLPSRSASVGATSRAYIAPWPPTIQLVFAALEIAKKPFISCRCHHENTP